MTIRKPDSTESDSEDESDDSEEESDESDSTAFDSEEEPDTALSEETLRSPIISHGQWVVVNYDDVCYPGEVTCFDEKENQYEVRVMHRSDSYWKWPTAEDKLIYARERILRIIDPPSAAGNRGQFLFKENI